MSPRHQPSKKVRAPAFLLVAGLVTLAVAVLVWIRAGRSTQTASMVLAAGQQAGEELAGRVQRAENRLAAIRQASVESGSVKPVAATTSSPALKATPTAAPTTMSEIIANYPELEVLELRRQRSVIASEYRELFGLLQFSPKQIQQFEDIQMRHAEMSMDLKAAARSQGDAGQQAVAALQQKAKEESEAALRRLLGEDGYRQYENFERTIPLRNVVVRGFAGAAALEGIPISEQQGEELMHALIDSGGVDVSGPRQDLAGIDWAAVDARAQRILTPEQFTFFTTVAPATSFTSRWAAQLKGAIRQAKESEAAGKK